MSLSTANENDRIEARLMPGSRLLMRLATLHGVERGDCADRISSLLARHARPATLLALRDVAQQLDIPIRAVRLSARTALVPADMPALVAFQSIDKNEFAVVEDLQAGSYGVFDEQHGIHQVSTAEFDRKWQGIALVPDRGVGAGRRVWRAALARVHRAEPIDFVIGGCVLLCVLQFLANQSSSENWWRVGSGMFTAAALRVSWRTLTGSVPCETCQGAARVVGKPGIAKHLPEAAFAYFASLALGWGLGEAAPNAYWWSAALWSCALLPFSLFLAAYPAMRATPCRSCVAMHVLNALAATTLVAAALRVRLVPVDVTVGVFPLFLCFLLLLGLGIRRTSRKGDPRGIAAIWGFLLSRPYQLPALDTFATAAAESQGRHEVLAFLHPACGLCKESADVLSRLLRQARNQLRIHVAIAPLVRASTRDRRLCQLLVATALARGVDHVLEALPLFARALEELRHDRWDATFAALGTRPDELDAHLVRAASLVDAAAWICEMRGLGPPAFFVDGVPLEPHAALAQIGI